MQLPVAILGGVAVACAACSSQPLENAGSVRLVVGFPPAHRVTSVAWRITFASGPVVRSGTVAAGDPSVPVEVDTSCPEGSSYEAAVTATASDGSACSGESLLFNVAARESVTVAVVLVCAGDIPHLPPNMPGTIDNCPTITSYEATPLMGSRASPIDVSVTATDPDAVDVLSYEWTATSGTFLDPTASATQYRCVAGGPQILTVKVSDGHVSVPCTEEATIAVGCAYGACGDGVVDPGEECDPPNGTNCTAGCRHVVYCGDGIVEDPEQCDPPNDVTCNERCQNECLATVTACDACEMKDPTNCPAFLNQVVGQSCAWGCQGFPTAAARTHCEAVLACITTRGCMIGDDPTPCLCGSLPASVCATSGAPASAPCAAEYAAAVADAPGTVYVQFSDPRSPVGIANNLAACSIDSGCGCH